MFYLAQLLFLLTLLIAAMWAAGRCLLCILRFNLADWSSPTLLPETKPQRLALRWARGTFSGTLPAQALQVAVGFAVLGNLLVYLLLFGQFNLYALLALFAGLLSAVLAIATLEIRKSRSREEPGSASDHDRTLEGPLVARDKPPTKIHLVTKIAVTSTLAGALVLLTLYPYQGFDFRVYQMPMAVGYAETGGWHWFGDLRFPTFPPLMNLWFAVAILFGGASAPVLAQLLALLPLFLLIVLCVVWAKDKGARHPAWAAALLLGSPLIIWAGTFGFIDLAMTLFTTLALYCLDQFHQATLRRSRTLTSPWSSTELPFRWLILSGVLVGSAMNVKYLAAFFAPFVVLWLAGSWYLAWRSARKPSNSSPPLATALFKALSAFAIPAITVASPWYVRTWIATGNPVFPFAKPLFGPNAWGWDVAPSQDRFIAALQSLVGVMSWDGLNPWLLPVVLLALFFLLRTTLQLAARTRLSRTARPTSVLEAAMVSYLLFSLASSKDHRYLLPSVALMAILGAIYWDVLFRKSQTFLQNLQNRTSRRATRILLATFHPALFSAAFAALGIGFLGHTLKERHHLPPTPSQYEAHLQGHIRGLAALRWAQKEVAPSVVYSFGLNDLAIFGRSERMIGDMMGPYSTRLLMAGVPKQDPVPAEILREWGVNVILEEDCGKTIFSVPRWTLSQAPDQGAAVPSSKSRGRQTTPGGKLASLPPTLEKIHSIDGVCIYRLRP